MPSAPRATVALVIPGRDCAATIGPCLESVLPRLREGGLDEIVFVNDHSTDATERIVSGFHEVRILNSPRRGAGAARNTGWRATRSDLVWFVDADCVADPDALPRLVTRLHELGAGAVGGSYSNLQQGNLVADLIHEEMVARHRGMGVWVSFAITANLLCRRAELERANGFDESLRLAQDLDLCYRLIEAGSKVAFDPESTVGHFHETRLLRYFEKQARQGYWRMHLYARHPRRASGDSYSGLADYAQPPLGLVSLTAALGTFAVRAAAARAVLLGAGASSSGMLLALQVPRTLALVAHTGDPRYVAYIPWGAARAVFRGAGMLAGLTSLAWARWNGI